MTRARARGLDFVCIALFVAAIPSVQAQTEQRVGLSRPGAGEGPDGSSLTLRRLPDDPAPCGLRQNHLFVNRPCAPRTTGGDSGKNQTGDDQTGTNHTGNNGDGPVIVLGGAPYNLDGNGPSGNYPPNPGGNPDIHSDGKMPDHFDPTPEPTYLAVTGAMFAAVWILARKRRTA